MTTLPQIAVFNDIIAYPDDENPNLFYWYRRLDRRTFY